MEGRPNIVDMIKNDSIAFIVNSTEVTGDHELYNDSSISIESKFVMQTLAGGESIVRALKFGNEREVRLQELHRRVETQ